MNPLDAQRVVIRDLSELGILCFPDLETVSETWMPRTSAITQRFPCRSKTYQHWGQKFRTAILWPVLVCSIPSPSSDSQHLMSSSRRLSRSLWKQSSGFDLVHPHNQARYLLPAPRSL